MFNPANKRAKAVEEVGRYVNSMLFDLSAGPDHPLPEAVFADPYVAGFLQVLAVHGVANVYRWRMPGDGMLIGVLEEALDRIAAGSGAAARRAIVTFSDPAHRQHEAYLTGRHEGSQHVHTLFTADGIARNQWHRSFRDHISNIISGRDRA